VGDCSKEAWRLGLTNQLFGAVNAPKTAPTVDMPFSACFAVHIGVLYIASRPTGWSRACLGPAHVEH